jgi:hypothetical protein
MPAIPYVKNPTWADNVGGGTSIDAADLNIIENGIFEISYAPAVGVFHNANQAITTSTLTALAFNSERFDQVANAASTMHDTVTNNTRLTCRYAGVYDIKGCVVWAGNATGIREVDIRLNGATQLQQEKQINAGAGETVAQSISRHYPLAVNDYVELMVWQTSGGNLNVNVVGNYSPEFSMVRVA